MAGGGWSVNRVVVVAETTGAPGAMVVLLDDEADPVLG